MKLRLNTILIFLLILLSQISCYAVDLPFEVHEVVQSASEVAPLVSDLDQDGDPDIVIAGPLNGLNLWWYENQGDATFTPHPIPTGMDTPTIEVIDFDFDGYLDLVVTARHTNQVALFINDGSQNFTKFDLSITLDHPIDVKPVDFDLDGDIDLVSGSFGTPRGGGPGHFEWHENLGNFEFTTHLISESEGRSWRVFPTDFDHDGDIDVLGTAMWGGLYAFENDGSHEFTPHVIFPMGNIRSIVIEDVDYDGDNDVVVGSLNSTRLRWYENQGEFRFAEHFVSTVDLQVMGLASADLDLDGDNDYVFSQYDGRKIIWMERINQDEFIQHEIVEAKRTTNTMSLADMDQDGDLDIVCTLGDQQNDLGDSVDDIKVVWIENKYNSFIVISQWYDRIKYYALLVLILSGIFYVRHRSVRKKNIQLENTIKERTQELQSERDNLSSIIKTSPVLIIGFQSDGTLVMINPAGEKIVGTSQSILIGKKWWEISGVEESKNNLKKLHDEILQTDSLEKEQVFTSHTNETLTMIWNFIYRRNIQDNQVEIIGFGSDISQRLEREIMETSAREQRKIGREIHDSLCQSLTGITFKCDALAIHSERESFSQTDLVKDIRDHLKDVTTQSRKLARGLYLYELENQGLHVAYEELTKNIEKLFNIQCKYIFNEPIKISDFDTATHLYRIAQEAISNAVKYSQSTLIQLIADCQTDQLTITIEDDGIGFDYNPPTQSGMGLNIILYRAKVIKARLNVQSKKSHGTKIICSLKQDNTN